MAGGVMVCGSCRGGRADEEQEGGWPGETATVIYNELLAMGRRRKSTGACSTVMCTVTRAIRPFRYVGHSQRRQIALPPRTSAASS